MQCWRSSAVMPGRVSQIGTSTATVTEVIGEHEPLELLVAPMIVPDAGSPGERTGICTTLPLP